MRRGALERLGESLSAAAARLLPDPFLLAVLLTLVTVLAGWIVSGQGPATLLSHWGGGIWGLLEFSMQMCLVLVTGHALADSPPLRRLIGWLAGLPRSGRGAAALVCAAASLAGAVHWGLGLIVGALVARDTAIAAARRGVRVHYPLLGAAGYTGMLVWHGGLSGSAPLAVATSGHFLADRIGIVEAGATLGSPMNLAALAALLIVLPWVAARLAPSDPARCEAPPLRLLSAWAAAGRGDGLAPVVSAGGGTEEERAGAVPRRTPAARLDAHPALSILLGGAGLAWAGRELALRALERGSLGLDLNLLNLLFLSLGVLMHWRPILYVRAVERAAGATAGIILQFPLYAGILGLIRGSGLLEWSAEWLVAASTPSTFPVLAFLSACVVNLFVPSGGGQWAVQGPIVVEAAQRLSVSIPKTVMALAYGDECTNMIQPFWALALLGITRLRAQQIAGYCAVLMLASIPIFVLALWLLPA